MRTRSSMARNAVAVVSTLLPGCAASQHGTYPEPRTVRATYTVVLAKIDRPAGTRERYGTVETITPEPGDKYSYQDGLVKGIFYTTASRINFSITNQAQHSIKIIWNEAAFIDISSQASRIAHEGVKYSDKTEPQAPTTIPAASTYSDFAIPFSHVYFREGTYSGSNIVPPGWVEMPLLSPDALLVYPGDSTSVPAFRSQLMKNRGKRFGLLLPIEIDGVVNEYTFWFEVQDATVQ